jgi:F-type H+-transporting ATPase subunit epsilon
MPLKVEVVATDGKVWSGEANTVVLRTKSGEIGLLPGHSPFIASLSDGPITIRPADGSEIKAAAHGGFVIMDSNNVIVLAETAELASEIDVKRAQKAKAEAEKNGDKPALKRAESRLAIAVG